MANRTKAPNAIAACPPRQLAQMVKAAALFLKRYRDFIQPPDGWITTFHGTKLWTPELQVRARTISYSLSRGRTLAEAIAHSSALLDQLSDFSNGSLLDHSLYNAQANGILSPFVSTTPERSVARSFALANGSPGFVLTVRGPASAFFDFNRVREVCQLPECPQFTWLNELGIPLLINQPFEVIQVDKVVAVREESDCVYTKDA